MDFSKPFSNYALLMNLLDLQSCGLYLLRETPHLLQWEVSKHRDTRKDKFSRW